jgi:hypothetical protein
MRSKSMIDRGVSPRVLTSSSGLAALAAVALFACSDGDDGHGMIPSSVGTPVAGASGSAAPFAGTGALPGAGMMPTAAGVSGTDPGQAGTDGMMPMAGMPGAGMMPAAGSAGTDPGVAGTGGSMPDVVGDPSQWNDPGTEPFVPVPESEVAAQCKLDINMLKASGYRNGAVFRYGKLCYSNGTIDRPYGVFSVTKTVAGTVMAAAYWDTRNNDRRMLPSDPISEWGGSGSTRISEYAGMVAGAGSGRAWGSHSFSYDTLGSNLARTGPPMERSLSQGSVSGARTMAAVRDNLFRKLGVRGSWPTGTWGTGANISLTDMGRIGIALAHGGWYNGEQVLDPDWVYWMTHPHWEDANTSYGMYTWLNHRGNATGIGGTLSASGAGPPGGDPCAPAAVWQRYPHPPSEATDCRPRAGLSCDQMYDTGVFSAQGLNGQFIVGHRGLDLVMVAQNFSGEGGPLGLWKMVRPALVALDPMFMGDEAAFCEAYGNGNYAPDLLVHPVQPDMQ